MVKQHINSNILVNNNLIFPFNAKCLWKYEIFFHNFVCRSFCRSFPTPAPVPAPAKYAGAPALRLRRPALVCIRVHSPGIKYIKPSAIRCISQCSFTGNEQISYSCLHLRRNTLEKNTVYSYTRTFIGQKNFPNLHLTDKTFFSG